MSREVLDYLLNFDAQAAERNIRSVADAADDLGNKVGRSESVINGMAGALGRVDPALEKTARAVGDVVGGFDALIQGGQTMGSLFRIGGPVLIGLGALLAIYHELDKALDAANEKMEKANKLAAEQSALSSRVASAKMDADRANGRISEEEYALAKANQTATAVFADKSLAADKAVADAQAALAGRQADGKARDTSVEESVLDAAVRAREILNAEVAAYAYALFEGAAAGIESKKGTAAEKAGKEALAAATRAETALFSFGSDQLAARAALAAANAPRGAVVTGAGTVDSGELAGLTVTGGPGDVQVVSAPTGFTLPEQNKARWAPGVSGVGAALGGDVLGAVSMAGPVGMGIAGGLGALQSIGDKGAGGVRDMLTGLTDSIIAALEALPEILSEVLPDFITGLVSELIPALVQALPEIIKAAVFELPLALAQAIAQLFTGDLSESGGITGGGFLGLKGNGDGKTSTGEVMRTLLRGTVAVGTGGLSEAAIAGGRYLGSFDTGGTVTRSGFMTVHEGEEVNVTPASGHGSAQVASRKPSPFGGTTLVVNAQGAFLGEGWDAQVLQSINRALGPGGYGYTNTNIVSG
jgi:hypothetical protein